MSFPFAAAFRETLAQRLADFPRLSHADDGPRRAAVVLALTAADDGSGETSFLLTRRASGLRAHPGQWALPGGRCDPGETEAEAGLRELEEELGLPRTSAEVLGVLDDYVTRSGYAMTPVVAWLAETAALAPNPQEVASAHVIRLDGLQAPDAVSFLTIPESPRPVIRLRIAPGSHIHAPTAAVIYQLSELAAGRVTRVADLEQPVFAWR